MGKTGRSISNALIKSKANVFVWDDNKTIRKNLKNKGYNIFNSKNLKKINFIVPSPGIPLKGKDKHKLIKKTINQNIKIVSELDLFQIYLNNCRNNKNIKVIAVTGTNGKSTIVSQIYHCLKRNNYNAYLIGNIGYPIFDSVKIRNGFYIIEVSSYQLESSKIFSPDISCITNITPDHLKRHKSFNNYAKAKLQILNNFSDEKSFFYDQNMIMKKLMKKKLSEKLYESIKKNNKKNLNEIEIKKIFLKDSITYNQNQLYTYAICRTCGVAKKTILSSLKSYKPLPYRQQVIYNDAHRQIINDSKSTNFDSLNYALSQYKNIILICGGEIKSNKINILDKNSKNVLAAIIIGKEGKLFENYFKDKCNTIYAVNLKKSFEIALEISLDSNEYQAILFSPGAASFDQYKNFEERGKHFTSIVKTTYFNE